MTELVDTRLFDELAAKEAGDVVLHPWCSYDERRDCYRVNAWQSIYEVFPGIRRIVPLDTEKKQHDYFFVFLVNYLLSEKRAEPTGEWISEKDFVGGVTFFRGPHAIPTHLISNSYGNDLHLLKKKCRALGGTALDMGDLAFSFDVIGSVRLALVYWRGDEDFPAEARLLLDSSVAEILKLDVVYGLLCDGCLRLKKENRVQ